jgi:hypothetical protein
MMRRSAAGLALLVAQAAFAQEAELWTWRGETSLRIENYDTRGDTSASPYPYSGSHETLGVSVDAERRENPFDFTRFQFNGTQSHSLYYSSQYGFYPERFNLAHQSGTAALPFQGQVGDYFGVFSFRTLQAALRGGMVDLQPQAASQDRRHSLVFLSGAAGQPYRQFQWADNNFTGASYLFEERRLGRVALNWVGNSRQGDPAVATPERKQNVWSAAAEVPFSMAAQNLKLETEVARFAGDHDASPDRRDAGYFGELTSRGTAGLAPLDWRLRYERYGKDYRPAGAVVSPDRLSREGFAGWRFQSGLAVRGRLQQFRDGWDSGNLTETNTGGLTLTGPLLAAWLPGWTGNLDTYAQTQFNAAAPTNIHTRSVRADAGRTFNGVTLRLGYGFLDLENKHSVAGSSITREVLATLTHAVAWGGWRGSVTYGGTARRIDGGSSAGSQFLPLASAGLGQGRHSVTGSLSYAWLNQLDAAQTDTRTSTLGLAYRYDLPQDKLGLEFNTHHRNATPGAMTEAWRFMLSWSHLFEKVPVAQAGRAPPGPVGAGPALDLRDFAPGRSVAQVETRLAEAGLRTSIRPAPGLAVLDYRMLSEIDQRQRLALLTAAGEVERAGLIIEFEAVGNVDSAAQAFERVRQALVRRYGNPSSVFNRGEFRPGLADDIQADQFIRLTEWRVPEGTIRFGIPRRLDRVVRMEVQIARGFPDPTQTRWSLEDVR